MGRDRKYTQYIKEDEYGVCKGCGKVKYLGDGLCQICWDIYVDKKDQNHEDKKVVI
jgi:hypothetical protein